MRGKRGGSEAFPKRRGNPTAHDSSHTALGGAEFPFAAADGQYSAGNFWVDLAFMGIASYKNNKSSPE